MDSRPTLPRPEPGEETEAHGWDWHFRPPAVPDLGGWDAKHAVIHALTAADHHHDPPYPRPRPARYDRIPPLEERERMRYEAQQKRARQHQGKGSGITAIRSAMQRRR